MSAAKPVAVDESEAALWHKFTSDRKADDRLALFDRHALLARGIAARHYRRDAIVPIAFPELVQLAYVGLLEAIDRFKPELGVPFRFYAARRITGSLADGIASHCEINRQVSARRKVARERLHSIAPSITAATTLDDSLDLLGDLVAGLALGFMLDEAGEADPAPDAFETLAWRQMIDLVRRQVDQLPDRERLIVRLHYFDGLRFDQAASIMGLTKGRISQIHKNAIDRLGKRLSSTTSRSSSRQKARP